MIDRVAADLGQELVEVPVGFKWFVPGLIDGSVGFGGEESAGASFLRRDGSTWTTDKDGILLACWPPRSWRRPAGRPSEHYAELVAAHGDPAYARVDAPADREQKAKLAALSPDDVTATELAGEPITAKLTEAPGNGAAIGGLKVTTESAWFAARPSGTEDVYKIYAESFRGPDHLAEVQEAARDVVSAALGLMSDADRSLALGLLDVLVGEWTQQVSGHGDPAGRSPSSGRWETPTSSSGRRSRRPSRRAWRSSSTTRASASSGCTTSTAAA